MANKMPRWFSWTGLSRRIKCGIRHLQSIEHLDTKSIFKAQVGYVCFSGEAKVPFLALVKF